MLVVDFWNKRYAPYIKVEKRPSTVDGYEKMWNKHLKGRMELPLRDFHTVDCETLLQAIAHGNGVSSTTLKHIKHLLSGIFRYAIRSEGEARERYSCVRIK